MPHAEQQHILKHTYENEVPKSWVSGGTDYQKASVLAAVSWHDVKPQEDPELKDCDLAFRQQCVGIAESIIKGNTPDNTLFALRAEELWKQTDDYNKGELHP